MNYASPSLEHLVYLPPFARFILDNKLQEYVDLQVKLCQELDIPLMKHVSHLPHEQLLEIVKESSVEFLGFLAEGNSNLQIGTIVNRWLNNQWVNSQLHQLDQNDVTTEDIARITYIWKKGFLQIIPEYSLHIEQILALIDEIDFFFAQSIAAFTHTYTDIFRKKLEEQTRLSEKVNSERLLLLQQLQQTNKMYEQAQALNHIGHYIFNVQTKTSEFTDELARIYGLDPSSFKIDNEYFQMLRHPADSSRVEDAIENLLKKGEPIDINYRIILPGKIEKILHLRGEPVVNNQGEIEKVIGTVQDVTSFQLLLQKLQHNEAIYKQAEMLTNFGNWSWNIETGKVEWTDQLYEIYGLEPQSEEVNLNQFIKLVHPDDREMVKKSIEKQYDEKSRNYKFRIITDNGETKIIHSVSQLFTDEAGRPAYMIGTDQDVTEQERLMEQLRISNKLHELAQALSHVGHFVYDYNKRTVELTPEIGRIYELEPGRNTISFEEIRSFRHPDDIKAVDELLKAASVNNGTVDYQYRIIVHDKLKTVHLRGEMITDGAGSPLRMIGTIQDITRQKKVEQQLVEQQNFIQKIADAAPSVIVVFSITTKEILFVNQGFKSILGYDPETLKSEGASMLWRIIHPDDLQDMTEKSYQALHDANMHGKEGENKTVEFTFRVRHCSGNLLWMHSYGTVFSRNNDDKVDSLIYVSYDITDSVQAGHKLAEQEHFIQQLADASPTVLYLYDVEEDCFVYVNKEIYFILEYTVEEALEMKGDLISKLYHPADIMLLPERKGSSTVFQHNSSMIQFECRMKKRSGNWCWMLVREVVFKTGQDGRPVQILGAALDINRRKEVERDLVQKSMQLEQSNSSLEEFAYVASHDLKEPLRKISTFGDRLIALQRQDANPDEKLFLNKIVDASQRMQTMINDILSISMISGNKAFQNYSLKSILDETLQTLEYKIEQKNAIITSDHLPEASIIPAQFRQLFQNLLSNSLKFMREGVQPRINITHKFLKPDELGDYSLQPSTQYLKIEFEDNGIGFENEYSGKIFQIFHRLHGRAEYEGSGIGLAICKKIVEHHGGVIFAAGRPEEGAVFTIILPA
ncbi:PAS domain-containing protein [Chitinophagaceae bacterium LB-8]|uniref:histidine kinase n=1 Tax=Paraflavisolibacter caeni TaxID=2982496 RepID=A0A9X3BIW4_9BACT|nr:PAS domain-containing protein [Paraflavisolibacter caeni]MCU7550538.1 PAS domain-containing protein [Paraflavisolibacter caeni]